MKCLVLPKRVAIGVPLETGLILLRLRVRQKLGQPYWMKFGTRFFRHEKEQEHPSKCEAKRPLRGFSAAGETIDLTIWLALALLPHVDLGADSCAAPMLRKRVSVVLLDSILAFRGQGLSMKLMPL